MKPELLTEALPFEGKVGTDRPVVQGVKLIGLKSRQGYSYSPEVLAKYAHLYEGKPAYFDHPDKDRTKSPRSFASKFGVYRDVQARVDGLYANLHYNPKHSLADQFRGWVENDPNAIGCSHSALCNWRPGQDGVKEVTEIVAVESVDIVATPATTQGLFESLDSMDVTPDPTMGAGKSNLDETVSALIYAVICDLTLSVSEKREKVLKALDLLDDPDSKKEPEPMADKPVEPTPDAKPDSTPTYEDKLKEAFARFEATLSEKAKLIEESVAAFEERIKKIKEPVSVAPKPIEKPKLTVDDLLRKSK